MKIFQHISFAFVIMISYTSSAQQEQAGFGRTILSFSPVQMSERTPTGFGVQYERFFSGNSKFSLYLPLAYSFGHSDPCDPAIRSRVFYAYPGIKYYPAGSQHLITYAVGPSLAFGQGVSNCDCSGSDVQTSDQKPKAYHAVTEMGAVINNSINLEANQHIYIGGEVGVGATYLNKEGGQSMGTDLMLQINFKVGYRF